MASRIAVSAPLLLLLLATHGAAMTELSTTAAVVVVVAAVALTVLPQSVSLTGTGPACMWQAVQRAGGRPV